MSTNKHSVVARSTTDASVARSQGQPDTIALNLPHRACSSVIKKDQKIDMKRDEDWCIDDSEEHYAQNGFSELDLELLAVIQGWKNK